MVIAILSFVSYVFVNVPVPKSGSRYFADGEFHSILASICEHTNICTLAARLLRTGVFHSSKLMFALLPQVSRVSPPPPQHPHSCAFIVLKEQYYLHCSALRYDRMLSGRDLPTHHKIEEARSSAVFVTVYQDIRCHNPKYHKLKLQRLENLRSQSCSPRSVRDSGFA